MREGILIQRYSGEAAACERCAARQQALTLLSWALGGAVAVLVMLTFVVWDLYRIGVVGVR